MPGKDPICGMVGKESISAVIEGKTYYFCAEGCKKEFLRKKGKK